MTGTKTRPPLRRAKPLSHDPSARRCVSGKRCYESKQISSLCIKSGSSQTVVLGVKASPDTQAGEYPITFHASTDGGQAEARLQGGAHSSLRLVADSLWP